MSQTVCSIDRIKHRIPAQKTVYVANHETAWSALHALTTKPAASVEAIRHDNSGMEFGAYQAGADRLLRDLDPEWVLFANDTFATHHPFGKVHRNKLVLELSRTLDFPAVIGQVVSLPRSYQIDGLRTHRWMTTNLFALNRAALHALDGKLRWPELDALVIETCEVSKFFAPSLDLLLREHLEAWLFRAHQGWHWYASAPLEKPNVLKMAHKARSILQEKYLAALLESMGTEFIDLNDLSVSQKMLRELERKYFVLTRKGAT